MLKSVIMLFKSSEILAKTYQFLASGFGNTQICEISFALATANFQELFMNKFDFNSSYSLKKNKLFFERINYGKPLMGHFCTHLK